MSSKGKKLIIGIGNPILSDDAAGIIVAEKINERIKDNSFDVRIGSISGLKIVDAIAGYDEVIIIDTIYGENPGKFYQLPLEELKRSFHLTSPHSLNLYTALKICDDMGLKKPEKINIYVIEAKKIAQFGEGLSDDIKGKIDDFVEFIIKKEEIGGDNGNPG